MIDHDKNVGQVLDLLDQQGITNDTFVQYSTDNGPHENSWPDAGTTPFHNEKNSNWKGAWCGPAISSPVPCPMKSSATGTGCRPSSR